MKTRAQLDERMQNLDHQTWLKKCGQLGRPSRSKLSLTNSEIQVKSRIRESILVFGGEIPLETWIQVWKFFAVYTPPKGYLPIPNGETTSHNREFLAKRNLLTFPLF
jgi:hypothetical protein